MILKSKSCAACDLETTTEYKIVVGAYFYCESPSIPWDCLAYLTDITTA